MSEGPSHLMIVTAHRGASQAAPENTIAAFNRALDAGVNAIETDIRLSRDGVPVLVHDENLLRVANSASRIEELTAAELAEVDVGTWMAPEFAGQGIPTLAWLAERCRHHTRLVLDLKVDGAAAAIAEVLDSSGFPVNQAWLCAWSEDQAADIRKNLPGARLIFIEDPLEHSDTEWMRVLALRGYYGLSLHHKSIDATTMADAHTNGLAVFAWTVNDPADMQRLRGIGVDGIISDGTAAGDFAPLFDGR